LGRCGKSRNKTATNITKSGLKKFLKLALFIDYDDGIKTKSNLSPSFTL
jgi:hypothetical protein